MRFKNDESGQVMVFTLLAMTVLCGFMALAIDVGTLFRAKRNVQIAADAASVAGALAYAFPGKVSVTQAAYNAASVNGVTDSSDVTVNPDPTDGYHTGVGYIEVDISQPNPTFFMGMITGGHSLNVGARSVAGVVPGTACLYTLDPTGANSLYIKGNSTINTPLCGIQVDSNSTSAVCIQGNAGINGPYLKIHGTQSGSGKCDKSPGTNVISGQGSVTDPYNNLQGAGPNVPPQSTCGSTDNTTTTLTGTVTGPGYGVTVCYTNPITIGNSALTTLGAGVYVFEAGVTINGPLTVGASGATAGATLDIEQGQFTQNNTSLTIYGTLAGSPYNSIAVMMPQSNTESSCGNALNSMGGYTTQACMQIQFGSGSMGLNGIIYAPWATVFMQDEGGGVQASGVVAYDFRSNSYLNITGYSAANPSTTPLKQIEMVE